MSRVYRESNPTRKLMIQLSVTLTDYALALECFIFAWIFYSTENLVSSFNRWVVLFFVSVAVASLVGGTVHGFLLEETTFTLILLL